MKLFRHSLLIKSELIEYLSIRHEDIMTISKEPGQLLMLYPF